MESKTGHAFIKETMRAHNAVYGGEMSADHYFRDFAYCDSWMVPWLLVSKSGRLLADLVCDRFAAFPSLGETNFCITDAGAAFDRVLEAYRDDALSLDETDGVSLVCADWRLNLRRSNTKPLVRLKIESRGGSEGLAARVADIADLLGGVRV